MSPAPNHFSQINHYDLIGPEYFGAFFNAQEQQLNNLFILVHPRYQTEFGNEENQFGNEEKR